MSSSRKLNSGVVRLVHRALDGNGDQCATVELSRDALAQVAGELGRLGKLFEEERLADLPVEAQAVHQARFEERELAAIERLEAKFESLFPKLQVEVPKRRAYPLSEAAILMGISLTKLKDLIRDRKINIVVAGARRRVLDAEINRYLLMYKGR